MVTGPVSLSFHAMPSIPENQGSVNSRFVSNGGCSCAGMRFLMLGIRLLSSFSAQSLFRYSPRERSLSVETMMSRSMPCPCDSRPWTFAKYPDCR